MSLSLHFVSVLGRSAMTSKFVIMAIWCRCLVAFHGTIFQITWAWCSRNIVGYVVVASWMLLVLLWVKLTLHAGCYKGKPRSCAWSAAPRCSSQQGLESSFGCATCLTSWVELGCDLNPTTGCVSFVSTWVGFRLGWCHTLCLIGLGLTGATMLFVAVFIGPRCVWERPICV